MPLNLYLLMRPDDIGYDEFDSCLVVAESEASARLTSPSIGVSWRPEWPVKPEDLLVSLIGTADPSLVEGQVVIASFNAG